jgi:hypothetical protein
MCIFFLGATAPQWVRASSLSRLYDYTQTHHTRWDFSGRVITPTQRPLALRNIYEKQIRFLPVGFEPAIPASEWPPTHALDRVVSGIGRDVQ